ncbi:MAG: hypothetical protein QOF57_1962, partial [Frankiaceae bacterium]|nr:hypothetical protein [Frankiaceae bacterium]
ICPANGMNYYTPLVDGHWRFVFEALDAGGSTDDQVPHYDFTIDTHAPGPPALGDPAAGGTTGTTPHFTWTAADDTAAGSGIARYRLEIDGGAIKAETTGCCSLDAPSALPQGDHRWRVVAVDHVGFETVSGEERHFTVAVPPVARLTAAPNPVLVGRTVTFDASASGDPSSPIADFQWDLDGDGTYELDSGATPTVTYSFSQGGAFPVSVKVTDAIGLTATATATVSVTNGSSASTQFGVSINRGAQYTRTPDVTVTTTFSGATNALLFSNDGGFFNPVQFAPQQTTKWRLDSSGSERLPKTVYVRFMAGAVRLETLTDDIILDETPPTVSQAVLSGAAGAATARAAAARKWTLKVKASDSNSGVASLQATASKRKPGKLIGYRKKIVLRSALRPRFVRARDKAGNYSRWKPIR